MRKHMGWIFTLIVALILGVTAPAQADDRPTMLVFGDSMTERHNDVIGSPKRGWWSYVAEAEGVRPVIAAESGSGYWNKGKACHGTNFKQRLHLVAEMRPDKLVFAGGFNDRYGCTAKFTKVRIKKASTIKAFDQFYAEAAKVVDAAGMDRSDVKIFTPWGSSYRTDHYWVWREEQRLATKYGFVYRVVRFNDRADTLDGIHPNESGSRKMGQRFLAAGGLS